MNAPYNGYTWEQREGILREEKRLRRKGDLEPLAYLMKKRPCAICDDPGEANKPHTQWHSEDYSQPFRFCPPATFIVCNTCHSRLHKRFPDTSGTPSDWPLFLSHLRSGGYGREFTSLYSLATRRKWQWQIDAGGVVDFPIQRNRALSGNEWWQTLTLNPDSLVAAWARPRPWLERPPTGTYRAALELLKPTQDESALLRFHAHAPRRSASMRQLAAGALASQSASQANLIYGKLAHRLAEAIKWTPEAREDGSPIWMSAVAEDWKPEGREYEWVMVPSLAALFN